MARKTFKLPEEMVERHKPRKEAMGVSWPEYWDGQAPDVEYATPEEVREIIREENRRLIEELTGESLTSSPP